MEPAERRSIGHTEEEVRRPPQPNRISQRRSIKLKEEEGRHRPRRAKSFGSTEELQDQIRHQDPHTPRMQPLAAPPAAVRKSTGSEVDIKPMIQAVKDLSLGSPSPLSWQEVLRQETPPRNASESPARSKRKSGNWMEFFTRISKDGSPSSSAAASPQSTSSSPSSKATTPPAAVQFHPSEQPLELPDPYPALIASCKDDFNNDIARNLSPYRRPELIEKVARDINEHSAWHYRHLTLAHVTHSSTHYVHFGECYKQLYKFIYNGMESAIESIPGANLIEFYLDLADVTHKQQNFYATATILAALDPWGAGKKRKGWPHVLRNEKYPPLLKTWESIYRKSKRLKAFEQKHLEASQPFIPSLSLMQEELAKLKVNTSQYTARIMQYLQGQPNFKEMIVVKPLETGFWKAVL